MREKAYAFCLWYIAPKAIEFLLEKCKSLNQSIYLSEASIMMFLHFPKESLKYLFVDRNDAVIIVKFLQDFNPITMKN